MSAPFSEILTIRRLSNQYILTAQKLSALYFSASFSESLSHLMNLESADVFFSVFFMVLSSCTAYVLRLFSSYDMSINSALSQKWHREQHIHIFAKWLIRQFRDQYPFYFSFNFKRYYLSARFWLFKSYYR